MDQNKIDVLIAGPTGHLGQFVTRECLKIPNLRVHLLGHNLSEEKDICEKVTQSGGKCIDVDVTKIDEIKGCTKGMHTVISCLAGSDKVFTDGQIALMNDAVQNGVKRFIPSEFGFDLKNIKMGELPLTDDKLVMREHMQKSNIKGLFVTNGLFMQSLFKLFPKDLDCWCDTNQKLSLISMEDCARFVAAAISKPERDGDLRIASETLSLRQIADIINKTSGTKIEPKTCGSIEDLKKKIDEAKSKGDTHKITELGMKLFICDGRGIVKEPQNHEFPNIKPITLEEFIKKNPESKIQSSF